MRRRDHSLAFSSWFLEEEEHDAKGNLYVAAGLKDHQPAQSVLLSRMSDQVTVTGTLVKKGGVQMIYIESVK